MNTPDEDVHDKPCSMCGEPIRDEDWFFTDPAVWHDEQDATDVYIHDRCAD
jgi:hypothetical protein